MRCLAVVASEEVWPRPVEFEVRPAWQFCFGIEVFGEAPTTAPALDVVVQTNERKPAGKKKLAAVTRSRNLTSSCHHARNIGTPRLDLDEKRAHRPPRHAWVAGSCYLQEPAAPFTVHEVVAQHFTSCALQASPSHCTVHVSPLQPASLQAVLPVQTISVEGAALVIRPHADSPLQSTRHVEAVLQSTGPQLRAPTHETRQGMPAGHFTPDLQEAMPGHESTQVPPSHVPPAGHTATQATCAGSSGDPSEPGAVSPAVPPSSLVGFPPSPLATTSFAVVREGEEMQPAHADNAVIARALAIDLDTISQLSHAG